ncbi:MAG: hypothetical protein WBE38_17475 [Terracidiphilus sp.]|jgi:hypothetical protein
MCAVLQGQKHDSLSKPARDAILEQLDRLLASPYFSHSRRFPNFMRFVVEHTLAGDVDDIKERTLGIEIFGKDADYDTAADPIVRVTAAEIRKRVAQYYQDAAHDEELRITLPSGSYIPQFHSPKGATVPGLVEVDAVGAAAEPAEHAVGPLRREPQGHRALLWKLTALVAAVALVAAGSFFLWQRMHRSAFDAFWQPLLGTNEPALVCIADQLEYSEIALRDAAEPTRQIILKDSLTAVIIDDLNATIKVAGVLQSAGKPYTLKGEGATTMDDLRRGPTIFVGAFDNAWTLRLTNPLRYHFANDANMMHLWIMDSAAPGPSRWMVDRGVQMATNNYRDYAIMARFTDPNTGKLAVVVAGIGRGGTRAAGEFFTDNGNLSQLMRAAHAAGDKKNMEVVLSTEIIDGEPGAAKMEAEYFW